VVAWAPMMTTPQVEDDVLEGYRVQGDAIAYDPQLGDRHTVQPIWRATRSIVGRLLELGRVPLMQRPKPPAPRARSSTTNARAKTTCNQPMHNNQWALSVGRIL
jgi:hypothetical protein